MLSRRLLVGLLVASAVACVLGQSGSSLNPSDCRCGRSESDLPLCKDVCQKPKLTPQQKIELQQANKDLAKRLAVDAHSVIHSFIDELEDEHKTYIKLSSPINGGHAIRFKFVEGDEAAVEATGLGIGLHVKGDSIEIPDGLERELRAEQRADQHSATQEASEKWRLARADPDAKFPISDEASKYISPEQASNLIHSNRANVLKLKPFAADKILRLLKKVADSHNHIRVYGAIKDGHVIDYELINGIRSEIKQFGNELDLEVTDHTISTKGSTDSEPDNKDHPVKTSDAFSPHPPSAEEEASLPGNCGKPRCPEEGDVVIVPAPGRALRSNQPNTMVLSVYTPPGGPKITN